MWRVPRSFAECHPRLLSTCYSRSRAFWFRSFLDRNLTIQGCLIVSDCLNMVLQGSIIFVMDFSKRISFKSCGRLLFVCHFGLATLMLYNSRCTLAADYALWLSTITDCVEQQHGTNKYKHFWLKRKIKYPISEHICTWKKFHALSLEVARDAESADATTHFVWCDVWLSLTRKVIHVLQWRHA